MKKESEKRITIGTVNIGEKARQLLLDAIVRNRISGGKFVREFEQLIERFHQIRNCVCVSSGTDADTITLFALKEEGVRDGDEVIMPALNFISVANSAILAGLKPVFVDVSENTFNIIPEKIEERLTGNTKILLPTHLFGKPVDMDNIMSIANAHNLFVVEDACEALGTRYRGKLVGTFGDFGTFSFYVAHIITTGEGGAIITDDDRRDGILRSLRSHGRACACKICMLNVSSSVCPMRFDLEKGDLDDKRFYFERVGCSAKMNELEAALGIEQMENIDNIIKKRNENLLYFCELLKHLKEFIVIMEQDTDGFISPLCMPIVIRDGLPVRRQEIVSYLEDRGVETRPMFGSIPTQQPSYRFLGYKYGDFPNAEWIGRNGFYVGIHQNITKGDIEYIVENIVDFFKSKGLN
ncbi:MAG: DegT/DnrJ/EryC1/StrS family aminotransferase [bacterium]